MSRAHLSTATVVAPQVRVWWDSNCPLCTKEIAFMKRLDSQHAIDFVDLHATDVASCPLNTQDLLARFHAQDVSTGTIVDGAAAFALMWTVLPPPLRWVGTQASRSPLDLSVLERAYVWFLVHIRPSIQRWDKTQRSPKS
ncbi:hypothetical protein DYB38_008917 [Aphanomyces astaci]|uniref:DUF393 domain-containing protein n=1 Tax=Aphanomyces astaci TaxID=112090 RepID=A0A397E165_APHAT|nr:hypothetical protein DYB38_008917 [Aphanomyces astaci]